MIIIELPIKAFCLNGENGKIEVTINEVLFSHKSIESGYDFKGNLDICIGSYKVHCNDFYSSTGTLDRLLTSLEICYNSLEGSAEYKRYYEEDLEFILNMTQNGHAIVNGTFREYPHLSNMLTFEMNTDQTFILDIINELKKVIEIFNKYN